MLLSLPSFICIYQDAFYELSRILMRQNVNNDISKDLPISCQRLTPVMYHEVARSIATPSPPPPPGWDASPPSTLSGFFDNSRAGYCFILLGGEGHCESKVFCPSMQCRVQARAQFLWCHSFFNNINFNKSLRQFLHLNALYPLAFVPTKKHGSCLSFRSFCFQIMWLTKYGHDYQKWLQPPIQETWPKTNPRILNRWRLAVIPSS